MSRLCWALNYDIVGFLVEIGILAVLAWEGSVVGSSDCTEGTLTLNGLRSALEPIIEIESKHFDGLPFDRYVFIIHLFRECAAVAWNTLCSSVNAMDFGMTLQNFIVCCRSWCMNSCTSGTSSVFARLSWDLWTTTPKIIRECYGLWRAQRRTDDHLTPMRLYTRADYLKILSKDHLAPFFVSPDATKLLSKTMVFKTWVKLYLPHDDS